MREFFRDVVDFWRDGWPEKITVLFFVACVGFLILIGVGVFQWFSALSLKEGVVIDKGHASAWVQTTFITVSSGSSTMMIPQTIYYPEDWTVTIEGNDPKGVHKQRTASISQSSWALVQVGQTLKLE